jgi:knotted carbamoyltransferase YgeW
MKPLHRRLGLLQQIDSETLDGLLGRSMLLTAEWSTHDIAAITVLQWVFQDLDRAGVATDFCRNELFYALFFDQSTRTKSSWAGAAARLGASPVIVDGSSTQVSHGESAEETGIMLGMNAHAMGIRHDKILGEGNRFMLSAQRGIDHYLRATDQERAVPVVNLQCDIDHPTQTLADLSWLLECSPQGLGGRTITVSWAYSPSYAKPLSVPQGLITLLTRFGANIRLAHPPGYGLMPDTLQLAKSFAAESGGSFAMFDDMGAAFEGADVVYPKSWGPMDLMLERVAANTRGDEAELDRIEGACLEQNWQHTDWICDEARMGMTRDGDALYMHCLPADIGAEVSSGVMGHARMDLARQANKKIYVIMALLAAAKVEGLRDRLTSIIESLSDDAIPEETQDERDRTQLGFLNATD